MENLSQFSFLLVRKGKYNNNITNSDMNVFFQFDYGSCLRMLDWNQWNNINDQSTCADYFIITRHKVDGRNHSNETKVLHSTLG